MRVDQAKHLDRREPSALRGWLSSSFAEHYRRRLVIAAALALAIHEIIAGVIPAQRASSPPPVEKISMAKMIRIEHRATPTPRPTPVPTPKPTPVPVVKTKIVAETHVKPHIVNPGNPSAHQKIRRIASARPLVHTKYHSKPAAIHVPTGGHGAGTSTTAKADTGGIGPGGTGTGESGTGSGTGGAPMAHEPCGYVEFEPTQTARVDRDTGRVWEDISIVVHFPDGSQQSVPLDYPFYYPSESQDPFVNQKLDATFQFPPESQRANEPPLVQYVMQHTTPDGYTLLRDCPGAH